MASNAILNLALTAARQGLILLKNDQKKVRGAGVRLWFYDDLEGYLFVPYRQIDKIDIQRSLSSQDLESIKARLAENDPTAASRRIASEGGYRQLYIEHVLQADEGCDFDFLVGCRGAAVPRHSH